MKRTLLAAAVLLVGLASAQTASAAGAYDWIWDLADEFGTPYSFAHAPINDAPAFLLSHNKIPKLAPLGPGLALDNGTGNVVISGVPYDAIPGLFTELSGIHSDVTSLYGGKASSTHTHFANQITNFDSAVDARIASSSMAQSNWTETATTSGQYIQNKPSFTFGTTTRSLNTAFKIAASSSAIVSYTVDIATTLSLTGGATGTVTLEYADDSGFTTNVKTVQSSVNGNTGTLTIGLALTQTATASLSGVIPANKWVRISTANTAGTPTFTYRMQQETLLPL